jgi:putative DNA primase/helicase
MEVAAICEQDWRLHRVFEHRQKRWYVEKDGIWEVDEIGQTFRDAQEICKAAGGRTFETLKKVKAVEELARNAPGVGVTTDIFDRSPYVLGTPAGHVDLHTGRPMAPDPSLYITMSTSVAPDESCAIPMWTAFLNQVTCGDAGVIRVLQQWCGYSLTGDTSEQKLAFVYGAGGNGKGVLMRTIADILGTYAHRAKPVTFATGERHPTEIAAMRGKRFVYCSETERGQTWAAGLIKDITGGDKLRARFMRQDEFEFQPEFKLIVSGNDEPQIESVDQAMRRRFFVIPFDRQFEGSNQDPHLGEKLRREWPGILWWMIQGCLDWQQHGLVLPERVRTATERYFERQDVFTQWLEEHAVRGVGLQELNTRVFQSWEKFAKACGEPPGTNKTFSATLNKVAGLSGPHPTHIGGKSCRAYRGLRVVL